MEKKKRRRLAYYEVRKAAWEKYRAAHLSAFLTQSTELAAECAFIQGFISGHDYRKRFEERKDRELEKSINEQ
jgi:hypothetical protein